MHDMTPKRFAEAKDETTAHAHEVIAHLYKAMLGLNSFNLIDGTPVSVKMYQPPQINEEGEATCGIDVILPNGHLEFTMRNSGWGKSFAAEHVKKKESGTRGARRR
jgi:hypothetical protein